MSVASTSRNALASSRSSFSASAQTRSVSSSPYGRTHVWKHRPNKLPNPIIPQFPQKVIRSDGSAFTHWTTSPRSLIRLTRDVTNNPMWNTAMMRAEGAEEESETTGRLGRFNRRFSVSVEEGAIDWDDFSELSEGETKKQKTSSGPANRKAGKK